MSFLVGKEKITGKQKKYMTYISEIAMFIYMYIYIYIYVCVRVCVCVCVCVYIYIHIHNCCDIFQYCLNALRTTSLCYLNPIKYCSIQSVILCIL